MIVAKISPCKPNISEGFTLFSLVPAFKEYEDLLKKLGFKTSTQNHIKVCFQADNFPSESFSNEYGESFLNKMADVASAGAAELTQMTGSKTATQALNKIGGAMKAGGGLLGQLGQGLQAGMKSAGDAFKALTAGSPEAARLGKLANKLAGGARVDFPNVWKNSGYSPSYNFTVKLYNPVPKSDDVTEKFLIAPLAALLVLTLPISDDGGETYNYPFFCKVDCPGLFKINSGAISSISVQKGVESQVGFNQRIGMVELRIEFVDLHTHMINGGKGDTKTTLYNYLENLRDSTEIEDIYETPRGGGGASNLENQFADVSQPQGGPYPEDLAPDRIDSSKKTTSDNLQPAVPEDLVEPPPVRASSSEPTPPATITQMPEPVQKNETEKAESNRNKGIAEALRQKLLAKRTANLAKKGLLGGVGF